MNLILLRHGISTRKVLGVWGRLTDAPLDRRYLSGLDNSRAVISLLETPTIFSSPLRRCIQSVEYLFPYPVAITTIDDFRAYHSGQFESATEAFIKNHYPNYLAMTYAERFISPVYGEESLLEQTIRVRRGLVIALSQATRDNVLVCSHFSVINVIANLVNGNNDIATYGSGTYDIAEGCLLQFRLDKESFLRTIRAHE